MQAEQQSELPDDKNFPFYELRFIMRVLSHEGDAPREDWKTARGMAREIFVRWHSEKLAALSHHSTPQGWKQIGWTCGDGDCGRIHESPGADGSYAVPVYVPSPPEQGGKG